MRHKWIYLIKQGCENMWGNLPAALTFTVMPSSSGHPANIVILFRVRPSLFLSYTTQTLPLNLAAYLML